MTSGLVEIAGIMSSNPGSLSAARNRYPFSSEDADVIEAPQSVLAVLHGKRSAEKGKHYHFEASAQCHTLFLGEIINRQDMLKSAGVTENPDISDAQIFWKLYNKFGPACITKIDGMFSAALLKETEYKAWLFLDRIGGIRSLYYCYLPDAFIFSSRLRIVPALCPNALDLQETSVVSLFLQGFISPPETIIDKVYKVAPGESVQYFSGGLRREMLDRVIFDSRNIYSNPADTFREMLEGTLHHMSAEPEIGFLLSGGIDSSVLVALASKQRRINTFTASFPSSNLDESEFAQIVAKSWNTEHYVVSMAGSDMIEDLPVIVWHMDEPFSDYSVIPTYYLFKEISKSTSIVVSGDGPDHLMGRYYPLAAKRYIAKQFSNTRGIFEAAPLQFLNKIARSGRGSLAEAYKDIFLIPTWGLECESELHNFFARCLLSQKTENPFYPENQQLFEKNYEDILNSLSYIDFYSDGSFGVFAKVGKMAAANGLTIREPYLSRRISDFLASLPISHKVHGSLWKHLVSKARSKSLLRDLGSEILPSEIVSKRKGGFTPPLGLWLRDKIRGIEPERLFGQAFLQREYFSTAYIREMLAQHRDGIRDWTTVFFLLLAFDIWLRIWSEKSFTAAPSWKLSEMLSK